MNLKGVIEISYSQEREYEESFEDTAYVCIFEDSAGKNQIETVNDELCCSIVNCLNLKEHILYTYKNCVFKYALPNVSVEDAEDYLKYFNISYVSSKKFSDFFKLEIIENQKELKLNELYSLLIS